VKQYLVYENLRAEQRGLDGVDDDGDAESEADAVEGRLRESRVGSDRVDVNPEEKGSRGHQEVVCRCTNTHIYIYIYICIYICVNIYIYISIYINISIPMSTLDRRQPGGGQEVACVRCVCVYISIYVYVYMHIYIYAYIYIYI